MSCVHLLHIQQEKKAHCKSTASKLDFVHVDQWIHVLTTKDQNAVWQNQWKSSLLTKPVKVKSADNSDSEHEYRAESDENNNSKTNTPRRYAWKKTKGTPASKQSPMLQGSVESNLHESRHKATYHTAGEEQQL